MIGMEIGRDERVPEKRSGMIFCQASLSKRQERQTAPSAQSNGRDPCRLIGKPAVSPADVAAWAAQP
jgi:hypothetical protein